MLFSPGETRQCVEAVPENGRGEVEAQAGLPLHLRPAQVHQTGPHGEFISMPVTFEIIHGFDFLVGSRRAISLLNLSLRAV